MLALASCTPVEAGGEEKTDLCVSKGGSQCAKDGSGKRKGRSPRFYRYAMGWRRWVAVLLLLLAGLRQNEVEHHAHYSG